MKALLLLLILICFSISLHAASFTYSYDTLDRITNAAYSDGSCESYSYDKAGNRGLQVTLAATNLLDVTPPSVPTNLVSTAISPIQLSLTWNRAFDTGGSGLAGYYIYVNGLWIATTTSTNISLYGLSPNTQYSLTVAAFDHDGNISKQSTNLLISTTAFQPPLLVPSGFIGGYFQIGITNGTSGVYDVLVSTQLPQFNLYTNLLLPQTGTNFIDSAPGNFNQRFFRLRWNTNAP
jgi:hypothetical protein